jgi:hypothetical protein
MTVNKKKKSARNTAIDRFDDGNAGKVEVKQDWPVRIQSERGMVKVTDSLLVAHTLLTLDKTDSTCPCRVVEHK